MIFLPGNRTISANGWYQAMGWFLRIKTFKKHVKNLEPSLLRSKSILVVDEISSRSTNLYPDSWGPTMDEPLASGYLVESYT